MEKSKFTVTDKRRKIDGTISNEAVKTKVELLDKVENSVLSESGCHTVNIKRDPLMISTDEECFSKDVENLYCKKLKMNIDSEPQIKCFKCKQYSMCDEEDKITVKQDDCHLKQFQCDICTRRFTMKYILKLHYDKAHPEISNPVKIRRNDKFDCCTCNRYETGHVPTTKRKNQPHDINLPSCGVCKKSFVDEQVLHDHIKIHLGYKCSYCRETLTVSSPIYTHVVIGKSPLCMLRKWREAEENRCFVFIETDLGEISYYPEIKKEVEDDENVNSTEVKTKHFDETF